MGDGFPEGVVAQGLEVFLLGFDIVCQARVQDPNIAPWWQVEHCKGAVDFILGPYRDNGHRRTAVRVDPLSPWHGLFMKFRIEKWCGALTPALFKTFTEDGQQE